MVRQVKPLKYGFVFAKTLLPETKQQNRQIKIGSKAYDRLLNTKSKIIKRNSIEFKRRTAYKKFLPDFIEKPNIQTLKPLIRNNFQFKGEEKNLLYRILQSELNKGSGKKIIEFKIKGEKKFSGTSFITLKQKNLNDLVDILSQGGIVDQAITPGSDVIGSYYFRGITDFRLSDVPKTGNMFKSKSGKYFPYANTTDIDLKRYQIYSLKDINEDNITSKSFLQRHCLLYTLDMCGIDNKLISRVATTFDNGVNFAKKNFHKVSEIIDKNISLKTYDGKRFQKFNFGNKKKKGIKISLFEDHYFIDEQTNVSSYASLNYNAVKNEKKWYDIYRKIHNRFITDKKQTKIDSITLIKNLLNTGNFNKAPMNKMDDNREKVKQMKQNEDILEGIEEEQYVYGYDEKENGKKKKEKAIFYADVETDPTGEKHIPLLIGVAGERHLSCVERVQVFVNQSKDQNDAQLYNDFMNYVITTTTKERDAVVYFHNLKYDYHVLLPYIYKHSAPPLEKDGQLYRVKVRHNGHTVEFRDSYKLIPQPLRNFNKTFNLGEKYNKKEAIAYNYYNLNNLSNIRVKVDDYMKHLPKELYQTLYNNLRAEQSLFNYHKSGNDYYFDPIAYYRYYLQYDVYILYLGLNSFKKSIDVITNNKLNLFDCLTISSLTDKYMKMNGSYNGVYSVSGNLRDFISKAVTGGRVQVNEKYKNKIIEGKIADYDGVSLYPSAIDRLCKEKGLPTGKCQRINVYTKEELDEYKYYIVKVLITKINKHQQLPMVSYKDDNGILQYTNKIDKPIETVIDMITLEDWVKYQKIEYKILDGVFWNNTYNKQMGVLNKGLFNDRLKYKKDKNEALQQVTKLMLNSTYGKSITKKTKHTHRIVDAEKKDQYIETYFSLIESYNKLPNGETKIKLCDYDDTVNYAHIGVFILSYSKRIMNEVFDIANTHKCPLYYTDTDSIHCNYDDVKIIENEFRKEYNKELTGKQLGQFHIDFNLKGAVGEIYAIKSIFLGKKSYIDVLESKNEKGETIQGIHFRMKGIPEISLQHHADIHYNGDLVKLYEDLTKGKSMKIILNPKNVKVMFEYKDNAINTRADGSFTRTIKF